MQNEIIQNFFDGVKWVTICGGSYFTFLIGCHIYDILPFHKKIKSQEQLEMLVYTEAKKLGLNSDNIYSKFNSKKIGVKMVNDNYCIHLKADYNSTKNTIRHELYHIFKGHCFDRENIKNKLFNQIDYYFRRELQATIYGTFGIKV
jgi:hypothetical protein